MEKLSFYFIILLCITIDFPVVLGINKYCYNSENQTIPCDNCNGIKVQLGNVSELGVAEVKISGALTCVNNKYRLILEIYDEIIYNENECGKGKLDEEKWKVHTDKYYNRITTPLELPACNETEIISFSEIYTGCYRVKIGSSCDETHDTMYKFLKTEHKMDKINRFVVDGSCRNDGNLTFNETCFITIALNNTFVNNKIHLHFTSLLTNYTPVSNWKIHCPLRKGLEERCNIIDNENAIVECSSRFVDEPYINCNIQNMNEVQHLTIILVDEPVRCSIQETVWRNHSSGLLSICTFNYDLWTMKLISTLPTPITTTTPPLAESNVLVIVIILILVGIICIIVIIYIRRRRIREIQDDVSYNRVKMEEQTNENFDIFLVYARDCDVVMETMNAFKLVLEECIECTVYDIHHPSFTQDISSAPEAWVISKLSRPGPRLKTLLLATRCADLQLRHPSLLYAQQRCHDDLFPLAARLLADSRHCTSYESLFVLNFSSDNQEYESFESFTPGRRFALPESVRGLLEQLGCRELEESERMGVFYDKCRELDVFVNENPMYIADVLNVQIENNVSN